MARAAAATSTPPKESFAALLNESLGAASGLEGTVIKGTVVAIENDTALIDVGLKSEGRVSLREFAQAGRPAEIRVGDKVEVYLERMEDKNGEAMLSREKAKREEAWTQLEKSFQENLRVTGVIFGRVKGGFTVDLSGAVAFLPGSQVDIRPVRDVGPLMGTPQPFQILKMDRSRGNIVVSRRAVLEESRAEQRSDLIASLKEGQVLQGVVKNLTDYGAFVDLGGVDGLLHVTDMSWGRLQNPNELFRVGDNIQVKVLKFDRERERVSLGYKQLLPDPWSSVEERFPVGTRVNGRVASVADYGAFVELESGVEGLVHVSEMSWSKRVKHPSKLVGAGDTVEVEVLSVDPKARRISLGMKQVQENPWRTLAERYQVGDRVHGKVRNLTDFGAFVEIEDGVDGLVHVSELSWKHVDHPSEVVEVGQEVEVEVLDVDLERERVSLSLKATQEDPWRQFARAHAVGDVVEGRVTKLVPFGAFVELDDAIEGLVHISELAEHHVERPEDEVNVHDRIEVRIIDIDLDPKLPYLVQHFDRLFLILEKDRFSDLQFQPLCGEPCSFENARQVLHKVLRAELPAGPDEFLHHLVSFQQVGFARFAIGERQQAECAHGILLPLHLDTRYQVLLLDTLEHGVGKHPGTGMSSAGGGVFGRFVRWQRALHSVFQIPIKWHDSDSKGPPLTWALLLFPASRHECGRFPDIPAIGRMLRALRGLETSVRTYRRCRKRRCAGRWRIWLLSPVP